MNNQIISTSIIIVNYNTHEYIANCIVSIKKQIKKDSYEVIIVDNGSKEGSVDFIKQLHPSIVIIRNNANLGFGTACNIGARNAKGETLLFLNPDIIIQSDIVDVFQQINKKYKNVGAIGGVFVNEKRQKTHSFNRFPSLINDAYSSIFNIEKKIRSSKNNIFTVDSITGACIFIEKSKFFLVNGFDEDYFMYFEETDLQYRLRKKDLYSIIDCDVEMIHLGSVSLSSHKYKDMLFFRSRKKYYKKHSKLAYFYISNMIIVVIMIIKIPLDMVLLDFKRVLLHYKTALSYLFIGNS